jgi:hypothetical protein
MEAKMKKIFLMAVALLLAASAASAATTQKWTAGWDNFGEPLNYEKSSVKWSVTPATSKMTVTFTLVGATPSKLYQVAIQFFCTTFPGNFGQFPNFYGAGNCPSYTKQGVTKTVAEAELGVVTTDIHGNGTFSVVVGPIAAGTYEVEFGAEDGAGCGLNGGGGNGNCNKDFQSPGPIFGDATTITIP